MEEPYGEPIRKSWKAGLFGYGALAVAFVIAASCCYFAFAHSGEKEKKQGKEEVYILKDEVVGGEIFH